MESGLRNLNLCFVFSLLKRRNIFSLCSVISILLFSNCYSSAQDIFDAAHTGKFAYYLYTSSQYPLSSEEYERLLFMEPNNDSAKTFLLKSYRKGEMFTQGIIRAQELYPDMNTAPKIIFNEYTFLLILNKQTDKALSLVQSSKSVTEKEKDYLQLNIDLLNKNWKPAGEIYSKWQQSNDEMFSPYKPIILESENMKHRSAALAALMSTVIPGSGKFYTGEWKDGMVSFIFIGLTGYQAYRGFEKHGVNSAYGWIYGGLDLGLYLGNIYGSYKSAKRFNKKHEDALVKKAKFLFSRNL